MYLRSELRFRFQSPQLQPRTAVRPAHHGRTLIILLTAVYLLWLFVRHISQPEWLVHLPSLLNELLRLAEVAGFVTLGLVWAVVWWQGQKEVVTAVPPIDIDQLYLLKPAEFEQYVAEIFRHKGYEVRLRGRSGDNGVDLLLVRPNGKRAIVQCKRYRNTIGPDIVRELYGTLIHEQAAHAFLVTTADISDAARTWAQGKPITLIDGRALAQLADQSGD